MNEVINTEAALNAYAAAAAAFNITTEEARAEAYAELKEAEYMLDSAIEAEYKDNLPF